MSDDKTDLTSFAEDFDCIVVSELYYEPYESPSSRDIDTFQYNIIHEVLEYLSNNLEDKTLIEVNNQLEKKFNPPY